MTFPKFTAARQEIVEFPEFTAAGQEIVVRRSNKSGIELLGETPEGRALLAEARRVLSPREFDALFGRDHRWDFSPLNLALSAIVIGFTAIMIFLR